MRIHVLRTKERVLKPPPLRYVRPTDLAQAVCLFDEFTDQNARLLAGGQSLIPLLNMRLAQPEIIVDIGCLAEIDYIRTEPDAIHIGAATTESTVLRGENLLREWALLSDAIPLIGNQGVRNRGTVGGSIAHCDPAAEWPALLLALDGVCTAYSSVGAREILAADMFHGFLMTSLNPGEILSEITFPRRKTNVGSAFVEVSRRSGDFSLVGVAVVLTLGSNEHVSDARIALSGAGPAAARATQAEFELLGHGPTRNLVSNAAAAVSREIDPSDDTHASGSYRRRVARALTERAISVAFDRAMDSIASDKDAEPLT